MHSSLPAPVPTPCHQPAFPSCTHSVKARCEPAVWQALCLALGTHTMVKKADTLLSPRSLLSRCHIQAIFPTRVPCCFPHLSLYLCSVLPSCEMPTPPLGMSPPTCPAQLTGCSLLVASKVANLSPHPGPAALYLICTFPCEARPCFSMLTSCELPQGQGWHLASARPIAPGTVLGTWQGLPDTFAALFPVPS